MLNVVIFGAPGSGKGTQSHLIAERYGLYHISTGEVLRAQIAAGTELGRLAETYISQGHLIPDQLMLDVLEVEMDMNTEAVERGVIFDGFPRTIPQAEALAVLLATRGTEVSVVLGLEVDEEDLVRRMILRGQETGRKDDNPETIRERLRVFASKTEPLKSFYTAEGLYRKIDGEGTVESVFERITQQLDLI